ncbi:MAG: Peptidase, family [Labilithrix sp.]|nr:Peptidase, family [Labilithrix sp.]
MDIARGLAQRSYRIDRLDNGLPVVVAPQPQLHRAHVALYVRVGSRFETTEQNGLSHFLEHMLYRGTPRLPHAHDVNLAFESLGGYLYAATQVDFGVFSVTLPSETLAEATSLFAEVIMDPTFADIDVEKEIVCEEILEDLDDEGRMIDADNLSRQLIYPDHPLGFTITGDETRVRSFTQPMLSAHHARHYNAANSVLVFSGDVDPDRAIELANRWFARMPRGERVVGVSPVHAQRRARFELVENVSSQTELRVCYRAVPDRSEMRPAMDMLMRILDDGMSTRLYHRVCDNKGLRSPRCSPISRGPAPRKRSSRRRAVGTSGTCGRCSIHPKSSPASTAPACCSTASRPPKCAPRGTPQSRVRTSVRWRSCLRSPIDSTSSPSDFSTTEKTTASKTW